MWTEDHNTIIESDSSTIKIRMKSRHYKKKKKKIQKPLQVCSKRNGRNEKKCFEWYFWVHSIAPFRFDRLDQRESEMSEMSAISKEFKLRLHTLRLIKLGDGFELSQTRVNGVNFTWKKLILLSQFLLHERTLIFLVLISIFFLIISDQHWGVTAQATPECIRTWIRYIIRS